MEMVEAAMVATIKVAVVVEVEVLHLEVHALFAKIQVTGPISVLINNNQIQVQEVVALADIVEVVANMEAAAVEVMVRKNVSTVGNQDITSFSASRLPKQTAITTTGMIMVDIGSEILY